MRYLSVCSGIEAATVAWHPLGWEPVAFSEVEPFPCAVLAHHYPNVPNLGDMTKIDGRKYRETVELIVGGTPCQSFSVAGKRGGLADARGQLAIKFVELVREMSPRWIVWENVPGVLSSNEGRDFACFAKAIVDCGYHVAWRVLDAQYFGVPQRRRRVFVVGYRGDWRPAAAVLFEPHSLRGYSAPSRKKTADIAGSLAASSYTGGAADDHFVPHITQALTGSLGAGGADDNRAQAGFYVPEIVSQAMSCKWAKGASGPAGDEHHNLIAIPINTQMALRGADTSNSTREGIGIDNPGDPSFTLQSAHAHAVMTPEMRVRRLTPKECERLQGFPDGYTLIHVGKTKKLAADSPRYKALGNSMAVPVMRWLGKRIEAVERSLPGGLKK